MNDMARTIVFCVSEMAPDLVERWKDDLPTLSSLATQGVFAHTRYDVPYYLTPQMWATINTGVTPGTHGLFDYRQRMKDGQFRETKGGDVLSAPWWRAMMDAGRKVGVVNLPLTYPPDARSSFMISGQDAPGGHPSIMVPDQLYQDITAEFGRYHLKDMFPGGQDQTEYAQILRRETVRQADVFSWIAREQVWDCLVFYTSSVAMAQHYYWSDMEAGQSGSDHFDVIRQTFIAVDQMLADVIAAVGDEALNVAVVSECGAGPIATGVNLNAALRDSGFMAYHGQSGVRIAGRKAERKFLSTVRSAAQRYLPKSLFYAANRSFVRRWILGRLATQGIDWSQTRAFHRGKGEGNIYLNIKGRDPEGIVTQEDREPLIVELIELLMALRTPEGAAPVVAVHRREDLYSGPYLDTAPDLIIEWRDTAYMPTERDHENEPLFGERFREYMSWPTSGSHRPEGTFIAAGPNVPQTTINDPVRLVDLAPYWLSLNGVTPPQSMEGSVRTDLLRLEEKAAAK